MTPDEHVAARRPGDLRSTRDIVDLEREVEQLIEEGHITPHGIPTAFSAGVSLPDKTSQWTESPTEQPCTTTKANGASCSWPAISNSGHCFVHDPNKGRKAEESERFWSVLQWLRRFSDDREHAAEFVALHVQLELDQRTRKRVATLSTEAPVPDSDTATQQLLAQLSQLTEPVTKEIADTLLTNQEVLDRAEREQTTIWGLRDTPEGQDHPFNRTIRDWAAGTLAADDVTAPLLQSFAEILTKIYLEQPRPELDALRKFFESLPTTNDPSSEPTDIADRLRRQPQVVPPRLPQPTFQEVRTLAIAIADGPSMRRWSPIAGETSLRHVIPGQPHQTKFSASSALLEWWGAPAAIERLSAALQGTGLPATVLFEVAIGLMLKSRQVNVSLDELVRCIGLDPRSTADRMEMRRKVWNWLLMFDSMPIIGKRPGRYRDPRTREMIDLTSVDAFIRITGTRRPLQSVLDSTEPPVEVTFVAGPWLEQYVGNRQILAYYGDILKIGRIPGGKPAGAWAQSVGLALNQRWRERAHDAQVTHPGDDNRLTVRFSPFTRADLLDLFRAEPYFHDVLGGSNPKRARDHWDQAVEMLKREQIIGYYREIQPLPAKRQGWQDAWLKQPLDIRPADEGRTAVAEIVSKAANAKRGRQRQGARSRANA